MTQRKRWWLWAAAATAAAVVLRLPSLNLLLDRDEGEYATLAWLWRSGAGVPYRDWLEQKPPLAIAVNAAAQALVRDGVLGLRLASLAWVAATVLALFAFVEGMGRRGRLGWRLRSDASARTAAAGLGALAAAVLLSCGRSQSLAANTETWQTLPLLGALSVLFLPDPRDLGWGDFLAAGLCIGVASLFKQTALAALLFLPWAAQDRDGRLLRCVAWTALGALIPWAAAWAFLARQGAGLDFLNCTLAYNQGYVLQGQAGAWRRAVGLGLWLLPEAGAVAGLAALGWARLGRDRAPRRWLAAWLGLALVALGASGRYYPHYVILLLGPAAVLAGLGLEAAMGAGRRFRILAYVLAALALGGYAWADGVLWSRPSAAQRTAHLYGLETFVDAPRAAQRLRLLCPRSQRLFVWGDEAELYYLSRRRPATRFLFTYPFTGEAPPWPGGGQELLAGVLDARTGAAVVCKPLDAASPLQARLGEILGAQYLPDRSVPGFILGARRR